ncbi:MAG: tRNA pseudouridine(38-40) synthase TruA [Alphaproteobacteria bacterium]
MSRWKITIEYDGAGFVGWQRQANGLSVQQALEDAIAGFSGERVTVMGAGRTDAGVHALGQVAHFDLARDCDPVTVREAISYHLKPDPVVVTAAEAVPADFDARRSATGRAYLYRIANRRPRPVLDRGRVWHVPAPLDAAAMQAAARLLVGRHDFSSFRAAECQAKSPVRTLDVLTVARVGDEVHLRARARSFLHNQVRILTGTLKLVGEGRWPVERVAEVLSACDRRAAGPTVPPQGLYLTDVFY